MSEVDIKNVVKEKYGQAARKVVAINASASLAAL